MKMNEHKRVKHGHLPGDISRWHKIELREKPNIEPNRSKAFRKHLQEKSKKAQRRRDKKLTSQRGG